MTDNERKEVELKPCPHCGGKAKIRNNCGIHQIYCIDCEIGTEYWEEHQNQTKKRDSRIRAWNKRPQDNTLVPLDEDEIVNALVNAHAIMNKHLLAEQHYRPYAKTICAKFGKDNSGMVANEEFRLDRVEVFGGLAGKGMKHMYTLRPTRYENEQPPKERKVSLEQLVELIKYELKVYNHDKDDSYKIMTTTIEHIAKAILSLLNATE